MRSPLSANASRCAALELGEALVCENSLCAVTYRSGAAPFSEASPHLTASAAHSGFLMGRCLFFVLLCRLLMPKSVSLLSE